MNPTPLDLNNIWKGEEVVALKEDSYSLYGVPEFQIFKIGSYKIDGRVYVSECETLHLSKDSQEFWITDIGDYRTELYSLNDPVIQRIIQLRELEENVLYLQNELHKVKAQDMSDWEFSNFNTIVSTLTKYT